MRGGKVEITHYASQHGKPSYRNSYAKSLHLQSPYEAFKLYKAVIDF